MTPLETDLCRYTLPLASPFRTASETLRERRGFLVRIEDGETAGFGEAAPLEGRTESHRDCRRALEAGLRVLRRDGYRLATEVLDETPAARHGVNQAWLDLRARRERIPLYRLFSTEGSPRRVAVNGLVGAGSIQRSSRRAKQLAEAGFTSLKVKLGAGPMKRDLKRVRRIAQSIPSGVTLRLDVNGQWTLEQALEAVKQLPLKRVEYLEQPLPPEELNAHRQLREHVDVALDETLRTIPPGQILDRNAADVIVLKPMCLGGLDRARNVHETARSRGADVVITTSLEAVVGRMGCVHLAAALGSSRAQGLATADRFERDLEEDPAVVEAGSLTVPQTPGLGVRGGWGDEP